MADEDKTWTQRADEVLELLEKTNKVYPEGSPEKNFRRAVLSLCEKLKNAEAKSDGGQFIPPPLF